jgi:hypothetical protein
MEGGLGLERESRRHASNRLHIYNKSKQKMKPAKVENGFLKNYPPIKGAPKSAGKGCGRGWARAGG